MSDKKPIDKVNDDVISINLQPFLTPISIVLSAIIFATGIFLGLNNIATSLKGGITTTGTTTTPTTTTPETTAQQDLGAVAEQLGLNKDQFNQCVADKKYQSKIDQDATEASSIGISGTPGFVVGKKSGNEIEGYTISGALPFAVFEGFIKGFENNDQAAIDKIVNDPQYASYISKDKKKVKTDNTPVKGNANASLAIVEFTDLDCFYCQRHHKETYPQIVSTYINTNKIGYYVKDLPLSIHPDANRKALGVECAKELGGDTKFFEFADVFLSV